MAGCAAGVKLSGHKARVIAVEPEGAPSMYLSLQAGKPLDLDDSKYHTIAHGLAAPYAGPISFEHVKEFVDKVVLVSDDELREATRLMYEWGFVAETSGTAAIAAVMSGKIDGLAGKKVACIVSGSNIKPDEMLHEVHPEMMASQQHPAAARDSSSGGGWPRMGLAAAAGAALAWLWLRA